MNDHSNRGPSGRLTLLNAVIDGMLDPTAGWVQPEHGQIEPELAAATGALAAAVAVGDHIGSLPPEDRADAEAIVLRLIRQGLLGAKPFIGEGLDEVDTAGALEMADGIERLATKAEKIGLGPFLPPSEGAYQTKQVIWDIDTCLTWCLMISGTVTWFVLDRAARALRGRCERSLIK